MLQSFTTGSLVSFSVTLPHHNQEKTDELLIVRLRIIRKEADFAICHKNGRADS
jgi:hypothetical protein